MSDKKKKSTSRTSNAHFPKVKGVKRDTDMSLGWVGREYPQLAAWRILAVEWLKGETSGIDPRLSAMVAFLERYLVQQSLPLDPAELLARKTVLPNFYKTACPDSAAGIMYNNNIHSFLNFVLLREFSESDDFGQLVVSPAFHNPVPRMSKGGQPRRDESVHSPLPYGYIDELRQILAAGPHFRDWQWAQSALGAETGRAKGSAPDWFEVSQDQIDRSDPDCVWRERSLKNGIRLEMWSPVRWVALLVKLILPLRTLQVRMLDSGEADTWRYAAGNWALSEKSLTEGNQRRPLQQGVFRRSDHLSDGEVVSTVLYINTNKTADIAKSGSEKGYVLPWPLNAPAHQDVFYWLEKLRDWQEKYNPISRRTAWADLDGRHIKAQSEVQLAGYSDTCFLFRMREAKEGERHRPVSRMGPLEKCWFGLLISIQK